jgi:hypothetical protein
METVYKFCGKYGIEILRNLELKVTPPNQFNDPFEFTPKNCFSNFNSYLMRKLRDEAFLKEVYPAWGYPGAFQEFKGLAKVNPRKLIESLRVDLKNGMFEDEKMFLDDISKSIRVLCMSGVRDSILPEFDLENAHYGSLEAIRGVDFA